MDTDNYDARTARSAYYSSRASRRIAHHLAAEATLHDLALIGVVKFFEGSGSDPTGLPGYASDKLWLRQYANAQDRAGDFLVWNGTGAPSNPSNWIPADPAFFRDQSVEETESGNLVWAPPIYNDRPSAMPYLNVIIGHGAETVGGAAELADTTDTSQDIEAGGELVIPAGGLRRNTIIGALAGQAADELVRCEAIGNGAMRFAKYGNRSTAIGTLAYQWLGQHIANLEATFHDLFYPVHPSNPAWDAFGLETRYPGTRALLLAEISAELRTTDRAQITGNVGIGRNAGLHLVRGAFNCYGGYNSGAHAFKGDRNVGWGFGTLRDNLWGSFNTAIGDTAGREHQIGDQNVYLGQEAGLNHIIGSKNLFAGAEAGRGWTSGDRNVLIGPEAGQGIVGGDDLLIIQNQVGRTPLISGDFADQTLALAGVTISPTEVVAPVRLRVPDDAYAPTWNGSTEVPTKNAVFDRIQAVVAGTWVPLASSAAALSTTGNTTENVLASVTIPANAMGPNGMVRITTAWSYTNSANTKTCRVKFGGTAFFAFPATTTVRVSDQRSIINRSSLTSQIGTSNASGGAYASSASAYVSSAVNTGADVTLEFTGQNTNAGETITLEFYLVELLYRA